MTSQVAAVLERAAERFWAKVEKTETCWIWTGTRMRGGYGHLVVGGVGIRAHRYA